jgi:hypothetical protein
MGTKGTEQGAFLRARPSIRCWQSLSAGEEYADPPPQIPSKPHLQGVNVGRHCQVAA